MRSLHGFLLDWIIAAEVQNSTFSTPHWFFSVEFEITGCNTIRVGFHVQVAKTSTYMYHVMCPFSLFDVQLPYVITIHRYRGTDRQTDVMLAANTEHANVACLVKRFQLIFIVASHT